MNVHLWDIAKPSLILGHQLNKDQTVFAHHEPSVRVIVPALFPLQSLTSVVSDVKSAPSEAQSFDLNRIIFVP